MSNKVCLICEKPSQARSWAKALGGNSGSYKGQQYVVVPARGHLFEFAKPDEQVSDDKKAKYKSWDISNLPWNEKDFQWKRVRGKDVSSALAAIKKAAAGCDEIVLGGDVDPSGEGGLITIEIIQELKLDDGSRKFSRAYFSDEAPKSLQKAFEQRKDIPYLSRHDEFLMADFRSKWDMLSMQWTRIGTKLGDGQSLLRFGRLKSAMVLIVGTRLDEIANYVKKPFFQNRFRDENGIVYINAEEPTFDTEAEVPQSYHDSDVVCDSKTMKKTAPPKLIDLSTLAARLAPKGISADITLKIYQSLYEQGICSYPRTEDKCITIEQFNELLPKIDAICRVVGVDPALVSHRTARKTHVKDGMAHGANRPGANVPNSLSELDSKFGRGASMIYEILAKSYLAMLCEDYEYEQQKGHVKDFPAFVGSTNVPKKQGWKAVYDADDGDDDATQGLGTHAEPFVFEGANKKPSVPTMKWLMSQLARLDIGTGATRTSTYSDVTNAKAKYPLLVDKRGKISFAKYGEMAYLLLPGTHIGDLGITKRVQEQMKGVANGSMSAEDCLAEVATLVAEDIPVMKANAETMRKRLGVAKAAPSERVSGTWNGEEISFNRTFSGHRFTDDEVSELLAGKEIKLTDCVSAKTGKKFGCRGHLEKGTWKGKPYVGFKSLEFLDENGNVMEQAEYAEGTWKRKKVRFKRVWGGHRFTDEEVADLLAGKDVSITGLKSKSGKEYGVSGHLSVMTFNGRKYVGFEKVSFLGADGKLATGGGGNAADYAEGDWNGSHVRFKRVFRGKKLTDAQVKNLLAGKEITIKGLKSKAGKEYACKAKLANLEYNGRKYVGLEQTGYA